jgi:hypothetical protein
MTDRRAVVTQAEIGRAIRAAQKNGIVVGRVEVVGDRIIVTAAPAVEGGDAKTILERWRGRRNGNG